MDDFLTELGGVGWQRSKVLLSSAERAPFRGAGGEEGWEDLAEALGRGKGRKED